MDDKRTHAKGILDGGQLALSAESINRDIPYA